MTSEKVCEVEWCVKLCSWCVGGPLLTWPKDEEGNKCQRLWKRCSLKPSKFGSTFFLEGLLSISVHVPISNSFWLAAQHSCWPLLLAMIESQTNPIHLLCFNIKFWIWSHRLSNWPCKKYWLRQKASEMSMHQSKIPRSSWDQFHKEKCVKMSRPTHSFGALKSSLQIFNLTFFNTCNIKVLD